MRVRHANSVTPRPESSRGAIFFALIGSLFAIPLFAQPPLHPLDEPNPKFAEPNPYFSSDLLRYVEDNLPVQGASQNRYEAQCYERLLLHARRLPADTLRKASTNRINFAHMFGEDRARYRGALVHIEGRLRRLRQFDPPPTLQGLDEGLTHLYEGWIFVEEYGGNPYCVVCSELPSDLKPAETMDRLVECDAFFFKRYRYNALDGWRDAPLLIAKTIRPIAGTPQKSMSSIWDMPAATMAGVFIVIGLTVAAAAGAVWWYRRQDRVTKERVAQVLNKADNLSANSEELPQSPH
jgi:hypothetical protein